MLKSLVYILFVGVVLLSMSCEQSTELSDRTKDTASLQKEIKERTYYSGHTDLPANETQITSAGLGRIIVGDSMEKIVSLLKPVSASIEDKEYYKEGKVWPAKMVKLTNGKYIFLAMVNTINLVNEISTNDSIYKTKSGVHAGLVLDPTQISFDSVVADREHRAFTLGSDGVWFRVNKSIENKYFDSPNPLIEILKGAKVEELFIVCGDC